MILRAEEIARAIGGQLIWGNNDMICIDVSTDSRTINKGSLFIPLKGEHFDGHQFIDGALENGASGIITENNYIPTEKNGSFGIIVDDTYKALGLLAKHYRNKFDIPFVAITGSTGKTTTKEFVYAILQKKYNTLKSLGNFNNNIGVPLTLLKLESKHQVGVIEMGMNSSGEIRYLADIVRPKIGIITNIGLSHIERLGSQENIFKAKMEIATYLENEDYLIINSDSPFLKGISNKKYNIISYGINSGQYKAEDIVDMGEEGMKFALRIDDCTFDFSIPIPGIHNIYNALPAIVVGLLFDVDPKDINQGLKEVKPAGMRLEITRVNDVTIINDSYNASPDSMDAALKVLGQYKGKGKLIAALGEMLEMGDFGPKWHNIVGKKAADIGVDYIIAVGGETSKCFLEGALLGGIPKEKVFYFSNSNLAGEKIKELIKPNDVILVKGSRGIKMENIVKILS